MMKWKTRITEMLGIRYPIIQGAYAGFGTSKIAVPVSEAGGLGIITAGALKTPEALRKDIRRAKALTNKPIGVNLSVGICPKIDEMREVAPTLTSITWAAKRIKIPIIAAGGIGDARSFLAALVMGAEGVYMGTAFMATKECPITKRHKKFLVDTAPNNPKLIRKVLSPPDPVQLEKVMKQRGKIPDDSWRTKLEMVLLKEDPEQEQSFESAESVQ
jgi:NAD(P)H-dependent flavin oxidoreductase YrpB (nitropropane dioxygenase family)